ncbi:reverse transcriptase domain-containing protein, partial [Tanacetum coccineum]
MFNEHKHEEGERVDKPVEVVVGLEVVLVIRVMVGDGPGGQVGVRASDVNGVLTESLTSSTSLHIRCGIYSPHCSPSRHQVEEKGVEDFKTLTREEFCPSNEMQKLETELWNHAMVGAGHAAYTDRFHELARLVPHLVTPEGKKIERYVYGLAPQIRGMVAATEPKTIQKAVQLAGTLTDEALRNGSIKKNPEKRGNVGEPSKDRNGREDNKRTRMGNIFFYGKVLRVLGEKPKEKMRQLMSAKAKEKKQEEIVVVKIFSSHPIFGTSELKEVVRQIKGPPPGKGFMQQAHCLMKAHELKDEDIDDNFPKETLTNVSSNDEDEIS